MHSLGVRNFGKFVVFCVVDDTFVKAGTLFRNLPVQFSIFFCFSKRKRWQKKKSPEGFRFSSGPP